MVLTGVILKPLLKLQIKNVIILCISRNVVWGVFCSCLGVFRKNFSLSLNQKVCLIYTIVEKHILEIKFNWNPEMDTMKRDIYRLASKIIEDKKVFQS